MVDAQTPGVATVGSQPSGMGIRPSYSITGDLSTTDVAEKLLYLRVLDASEMQNSKCELQLDNRDLALTIPAKGAKFDINMGYDGNVRNLGSYELDEIVVYGPPHTVTLTGHAVSTASAAFSQKNVSWHNQPLFSIVQTIGSGLGLNVKIDPALTNTTIDHVDQTSQSDVNFLTQLAQSYNGTFKVMNGTLYFGPKTGGEQQTGNVINWTETTKYNYQTQGRGQYDGTLARYVDKDAGTEKIAAVGDPNGTKVRHLAGIHPDKDSAMGSAQSLASNMAASTDTISIDCPGNPSIVSTDPLSLSGYPPYIPDTWKIDEVEHMLTGSGSYVTMIKAKGDGGAASDAAADAADDKSTAPSSTDTEPKKTEEGPPDDKTITEKDDGSQKAPVETTDT